MQKSLFKTFLAAVAINLIVVTRLSADPLQIQGIAPFYDSGVETYRAALYVTQTSRSMTAEQALNSATVMSFRTVRSRISARSWLRDLSQRVAINNDVELIKQSSGALAELGSFIQSPFLAGDIIKLVRDDEFVELTVNDVTAGRVEQSGLFALLLNAWVGWVPPSSEFKRSLLSQPVTLEAAVAYEVQDDISQRKERVLASLGDVQGLREGQRDAGDLEVAPESGESNELVVEAVEENISEELEVDVAAAPVEVMVSSDIAITAPVVEKSPTRALEPQAPVENSVAVAAAVFDSTPEVQSEESEPQSEKALPDEPLFEEPLSKEPSPNLALLAQFRRNLHSHPMQFVNYPPRSQLKKEEGVVGLLIKIARDGEVLDVAVDSSSNFARLDRAAIQAVKKADPFPVVPDEFSGDELEFVIPFAFRLQ